MIEYRRTLPARFNTSEVAEVIWSHIPDAQVGTEPGENGQVVIVRTETELTQQQKDAIRADIQAHSPAKTDAEVDEENAAIRAQVTPEKLIAAFKNINQRLKAIEEHLGL